MMRRQFVLNALWLFCTLQWVALFRLVSDPAWRTAKVLNRKTGRWERCRFVDIKRGDYFKLFEPDGAVVDRDTEHEITIALSDPKLDRSHPTWVWCIECEPAVRVPNIQPPA